ncbi:hypothetical protein [Streptomyces lavendofoliae]|uniref:hypothetical protein n=1 Tax=Streptomyces lavendofoliae TaxID=67314 RepID=UPI001E5ACDED|nr:hypothetical protein [Streptomyces lavendofoliae]
MNARLRLFALLEAQGVPTSKADNLEAGADAGARCEVVELDGMAPASRGALFADGWDEGVMAGNEALGGIADRDWPRRGGRWGGAAELVVHFADVRQREGADLVRLEGFVRESVLPRAYPHTMARRRVLGEAGGLCAARRVDSDEDCILCALGVGHCDLDDQAPLKDGKPGWRRAGASV